MWFIGVEVEQETSAPPPKKNPGPAPGITEVAVRRGSTVIVTNHPHKSCLMSCSGQVFFQMFSGYLL